MSPTKKISWRKVNKITDIKIGQRIKCAMNGGEIQEWYEGIVHYVDYSPLDSIGYYTVDIMRKGRHGGGKNDSWNTCYHDKYKQYYLIEDTEWDS